MAESEWGLCKDCKWWQINKEAMITNTTMGLCIEEKLQRFRLRVSGNSGCNRFLPGSPARADGSGSAPRRQSPRDKNALSKDCGPDPLASNTCRTMLPRNGTRLCSPLAAVIYARLVADRSEGNLHAIFGNERRGILHTRGKAGAITGSPAASRAANRALRASNDVSSIGLRCEAIGGRHSSVQLILGITQRVLAGQLQRAVEIAQAPVVFRHDFAAQRSQTTAAAATASTWASVGVCGQGKVSKTVSDV